jgi:hypothetical protein
MRREYTPNNARPLSVSWRRVFVILGLFLILAAGILHYASYSPVVHTTDVWGKVLSVVSGKGSGGQDHGGQYLIQLTDSEPSW